MSEEEEMNIEILKNIKEYMQNSIDKGYHKFIYNDLGHDEKCVDVITAIDYFLERMNNQQQEIEETNTELERTSHLLWLCNKRFTKISRLLGLTDNKTDGYIYEEIYKELKELKKENIELINQRTEGFLENEKLKNEIENSISKDKIRDLLKQVNASLYHFKDSDKNNIMQRVKDRLEKILEE